ncbi:hypothetical protein M3Y97_00523900 [Aphelenchoides bicaudatus]|nr:hypothetical protein M3Y97_00523900 [Aphelenchoides bicaudatus]
MAAKRRVPMVKKCKNSIVADNQLSEISADGQIASTNLVEKENLRPTNIENLAIKQDDLSLLVSTEDENDVHVKVKKRRLAVSGKETHNVSDDENQQRKRPRTSAKSIISNYSESTTISTLNDEQKIRSKLPDTVVQYANKLEFCELKDFKKKVEQSIWNHFYGENSFERIKSNRPIPGFEKRFEQIKQAKNILTQLFTNIQTGKQLALFVRDYASVLKIESLRRFNNTLLTLISEHQQRERPSFFTRFCAIQ